MKTVYDPDGKAFDKEYVDAAECVSVLGWTWDDQKDDAAHKAETAKKDAEAAKLVAQKEKIHGGK
jgi:hypothetical protein